MINKIFSMLILSLLFSPNSQADSVGSLPVEPMEVPMNFVSDFPNEKVYLQAGQVRYEYKDVYIPGNAGLDIEFTRLVYNGNISNQFYKITTSNLYNGPRPKKFYDCLGTVDKISLKKGPDRLSPIGFPDSSMMPSDALIAFENYSILACNGNKPILKLPNGRVLSFNETIVEATEYSKRTTYLLSEERDQFDNFIQYNYEVSNDNPYRPKIKRLTSITRNDGARVDFNYDKTDLSYSDYTPEFLTSISFSNKIVEFFWENGVHVGFRDPAGRETSFSYSILTGLGRVLHSVITSEGAKVVYKHHPMFENSSLGIIDPTNPLNIDLTDYGFTPGGLRGKTITGENIKKRVFQYDPQVGFGPNNTQVFAIHEFNYKDDLEISQEYYFSRDKKTKGQLLEKIIYESEFPSSPNPRDAYKKGTILYKEKYNWEEVTNGSNGCTIIADPTDVEAFFYCGLFQVTSTVKEINNSGIFDSYHKKFISTNVYGSPKKLVEYHSSNSKKFYELRYHHDIENWNLNLPLKVSYSNIDSNYKELSRFTYHDKNTSGGYYDGLNLKYEFFKHGALVKKITDYYNYGEIKKITTNVKLLNSSGDSSSEARYKSFGHYKRGVPTSINYPSRYSISDSISEKFQVNNVGEIIRFTDKNGVTTSFGYDAVGRLMYKDSPNDNNNWLDSYTEWTYDDIGRVVKKNYSCILNDDRTGCSSNETIRRSEAITYDSLLRPVLLKISDEANLITKYKNSSYDVYGHLVFESFWSEDEGETEGTTFAYDGLGRQTVRTISDSFTTKFSYLSENRIKTTDARGYSTTTDYLAYGSPSYELATRIESPENITTIIDYDFFSNIKSVTQSGFSKDGTKKSFVETHSYDSSNRLCKVTRPDTGVSVYQYNSDNEIILLAQGVNSANSLTCSFTYKNEEKQKISFLNDNLGDRWKADYADNSTVDITYTRDRNGNLKTLTAGNVTQFYNYNSLNLLEDEKLTVNGRTFTLDYHYNAQGVKDGMQYPDGYKVSFKPNGFGQSTQAIRSKSGEANYTYAYNASYYPTGTINTFTYGNGVAHKTTLNTRKAPSSIKDYKGSNTKLYYSYLYDASLNVNKVTDEVNPSFSLTNLTYDGLNRLIETTGNSGIGSSSIDYDGFGNIVKYNSKGRNLNYTYDYISNRLTSVTGFSGRYSSFSYDDRGNVYGNGYKSFVYNRSNQLITSGINSYLYDGHGRRVMQTDSEGTSYSVYGQDGTLYYRDTPQGGINYIYLGDKLIAKDGVILKNGGEQHYRPYGESVEGAIDDVGYTGHKFDSDLGLSYMQARYYDPVIGRFYSNDPVDYLGHMQRGNSVHGFGRYTYANNNPYKYTDPDGEFGIVGFAIGFVADAAVQYATTGSVDVKQSLISGAVGAVTGGLGSLAKSSVSVGGKIVASQGEKIAASALVVSGSGTAGAGGYAVNESLNGNTPSGTDTAVNGLMSAAGPGKQVGNAIGAVAEFAKDTFSSLDNQAADIAVQATSDVAGKTVDEAIKRDEQ